MHGVSAPAAAYEIGGRRFELDSHGLSQAVAEAHAAHQRPRCLCRPEGVEMYVARLAGATGGYIVKRMPETGPQHVPDCPSYEPPADLSGLGQVLGSAITEDPATGQTTLKLDFALSKMPGRGRPPTAGGESDSVASDGTKLSLRGLLHYLWDQAELTRWHPGFAGKRSWSTVRRHLLQAAEGKTTRGAALLERLYIPEVFSPDQREAIQARQRASWAPAAAPVGQARPLMLLIGEVKSIEPARYGFKAVIKHLPDQGFAIDEVLYRRLGRRFEQELALWAATDRIHMVMIATFTVSAAGLPSIEALSLMPVSAQWLPVEDGYEQQLVERLVREERGFIKALRFNLGADPAGVCATLVDMGEQAVALRVVRPDDDTESTDFQDGAAAEGDRTWIWHVCDADMPALPTRISTAHGQAPSSRRASSDCMSRRPSAIR